MLLKVFGVSAVKLNSIYPETSRNMNISPREQKSSWSTDTQRNVLKFIDDRSEKWGSTSHIFFDDGLLGSLRSCLKGSGLFPRTYNNIQRIPKELDHPSTCISIAIENYSTFFSRAVAHIKSSKKPDAVANKTDLLSLKRTWLDVIADVAKHMPNSNFAIWQRDAQLYLPQDFEESLFNVKIELFDSTQISSSGTHQTGFWTLEEEEYLDDIYEEDLERISENWPNALLHQKHKI